MKYVLYAILIYVIYLLVRSFLAKSKKNSTANNETQKKRTYNLNDIQDAEYREVNKD